MARGRLVSRSLGSSRKFHELLRAGGKLGEFCQVLFPMLIVNSDEHGRLPGDAFTVKNMVLPTSPRPERDFDQALTVITTVGLIDRYLVGSDLYIQVRQFEAHQNLNLSKRGRSRYPAPEDGSPADSAGDALSKEKGREVEGKGSEGKTRGLAPRDRASDSLFAIFWTAYPKKKAKEDAQRAWDKRRPTSELLSVMLSALERQKASPDWLKDSGRYIPLPATWLNGARWTDEVDVDVSQRGLSETARYNIAAAEEAERLIESQHGHRR